MNGVAFILSMRSSRVGSGNKPRPAGVRTGSPETRSRSFGRRSRLLLVACSVALLWSSAAPAGVPEGEALFNKRCHSCHKLPDPNSTPAVGWSQELRKMAAFAGLNSKQRAELLAFLLSHHKSATQAASRTEDRALFVQKCSHCHTPERVFVAKPDADTLRHIVKWMESFHPGWISDDEDAERIIDYLGTAAGSDETASVDSATKKRAPPSDLYVQVCTACHTLERIFLKVQNEGRVDWHHVVARMQQKAPEWIEAEEAEQILAFLQALKPPRDDHRRRAASP